MTSEEQRYIIILAERGIRISGTCVPRYEGVTTALEQLDLLRAAGDALAEAAHDGLADIRDRSPVRPPLVAALAGWAAARGGSGAETIPESEGNP